MDPPDRFDWLDELRRYAGTLTLLNGLWETIQLPLYTLWREASWPKLFYAVLHCTLGDVAIAMIALVLALLILGNSAWPRDRYVQVAVVAIGMGFTYTIYSEWLNVSVLKSWAYSDAMPQVFGIGLSPLLQWLILPAVAFWRLKPV